MIRWCIRHFGQAIGTPLSDSTWKNRLDPRLGTKILDEIVSGKYIAPKGCPPELLHFLKAARRPHGAQDIPFTMSFEHFRKFCERQDEKKTSSPSGLHYGHYKTLTWDELLLRIKYKIIEIAYKHGVLLRRWTILWEVLLQKKERAFIHKFRNITLIEGDIQYLMKAIWSQTMMKAITSHLHPNQNALRGKVTQSSVLSHRIALDTMFVNGKKCIVIENDAVNCFDRILPWMAALAFYQMGLAVGSISFFMTFLEMAQHHVLIRGVPSRDRYAHSRETPIMGSGQGTGWAGPSWFAVADMILTSLSDNQPGLHLISPNGEEEDKRAEEMSVDDSRQGVNETGVELYNKKNASKLTMPQAANQANQAFERYLSLTGGRLAIEKTMFYPLYPDQQKGDMRYMNSNETRVEI